MAARKVAQPHYTDKTLNQLLKEVEKLPLSTERERVSHLEKMLDAGTIDEGAYVWLAHSALAEELDKAPGKESSRIHLEFGGQRLAKIYKTRKRFWALFEEGRQRWLAELAASKEQAIDRTQAEDLAVNVAGVLNNPVCPGPLHDAITNALCDLQTGSECLSNVDFLMGLFLSKPRQAEGGAQ